MTQYNLGSKWLIRNVLVNTINQPTSDNAMTAVAIRSLSICQTTAGIERHCQNRRMRALGSKRELYQCLLNDLLCLRAPHYAKLACLSCGHDGALVPL